MIKFDDFDLNNILIDEKSYENILVYKILYKTLMDAKSWSIRFDKIDGLIRVYVGTRYLVLFGAEIFDLIYKRIRYLIGVESGITYVISHSYVKIKVDSYDSLPLEKALTFYNVMILIKSGFNKDKNNYYYDLFLQKCLYI